MLSLNYVCGMHYNYANGNDLSRNEGSRVEELVSVPINVQFYLKLGMHSK